MNAPDAIFISNRGWTTIVFCYSVFPPAWCFEHARLTRYLPAQNSEVIVISYRVLADMATQSVVQPS